MKKIMILYFTLILILLNFTSVLATTKKPNLVSQTAILMDNQTGKILYAKNENKKMYPASTTKLVTAIIALENSHLDDIVTVSYQAVMSIPDGYSSASLQIGEKLTVHQLLQLLLVHSANDAANTLAEYIGGSIESFVSMMNTKVYELGLSNTHFTNTYGLHDDNHYTTAQDLAMIMKYCIQNENFRKLAGSASCVIPATNKYGPRRYTSTNELIIPNHANYYPFLTSGKTGFTSQAGDCLVSCSYKDNLELICVILGGKTVNGISTRFSETKDLYQYGYLNYSIHPILQQDDIVTQVEILNGTKETRNLNLLANTSINILLENTIPKDSLSPELKLKENINAPIEQGETLGKVIYMIDGIQYETDLVASHAVEPSKILSLILQIGFGFLMILLVHMVFFHQKTKRKKR